MNEAKHEWRTELNDREARQVDDLHTAIYDARCDLTSAKAQLNLIKQRAAKRLERTKKLAEAAANANQR